MKYFIYILRCQDNSLYTGITTDLARRLSEHKGGGKGAKYTAAHPPLKFEAAWSADCRSDASKLEYRIKALTKPEKELLIAGKYSDIDNLGSYKKIKLSKSGGIMQMMFLCIPRCTTCQKAQAFL